MKQASPSHYAEDIHLLKLVATFESRSRLRVKIFDGENSRYEVKVLKTKVTEGLPVNDTDYEFSINTGVPGFSVIRKLSNEVLSIEFVANSV